MPLYEYDCDGCGRFEVIQRFSDPLLSACPTCGKPVQKLLSAPAVHFKGTGWYVTDYARKSSGESKAAKGGEPKPSGSTADASSPTSTASKNSAASNGSGPSNK